MLAILASGFTLESILYSLKEFFGNNGFMVGIAISFALPYEVTHEKAIGKNFMK